MAQGFDRFLNAAECLLRGVSVAVDTSGLAAAAAVVGGAINIRGAIGTGGAVTRRAERIAKADMDRLATGEWPKDAEILFPQMLDRAMPSPERMITLDLRIDPILDTMRATLAEAGPEYRTHGLIDRFCTWLRPSLAELLADQSFREDLAPIIAQETLDRLTRIETALASLAAQYGSVGAALDNVSALATASRDQLEALAGRFGIADAWNIPSPTLREALDKKAEEFRALKLEIEALKDVSDRLDNLVSVAEGALERFDFEEAEALLKDAREITRQHLEEPLKANAVVMERQADLALLRGRVEEAYRILSAAADSFASVDPEKPAILRYEYMQKLYYHGLRFGGPGSYLALKMIGDGVDIADRERFPETWAMCKNAEGLALQTLGKRETGIQRLDEAVAAYRAALEVKTRNRVPLDWAAIQMNLGNALAILGERETGTQRLDEAVAAFRAALEVRTRDKVPIGWAMTQNNLGTVHLTLAERETGTQRLDEAVTAFRAALQVYTRDRKPLDWARLQNNLGNAFRNLGQREPGTQWLDEAVAAYRAALEVRIRDREPLDWAGTHNNLGNALTILGKRETGTQRIDEAVAAYHAALEVRTREALPVDWAITQENLARAQLTMANHPACTDPRPPLTRALEAAEAALSVYDPEHMPFDHETATKLRDDIRAALAALDP